MASPSRPLRPAPSSRGEFLLCGCQGGAEGPLAARQAEVLPDVRRAAWRRGVVTFRLGGADPADDFSPPLVFARTTIRCFGQVTGQSIEECAAAVSALAAGTAWDTVHVWPRDTRVGAALTDIRGAVLEACGIDPSAGPVARPGDLVLDCVLDSTLRWWVGWHRAAAPHSTWPGGFYPGQLAPHAVSRAWLKLDEAIASFRPALQAGQRACEMGAAPGGACQRLLEAGLDVVGIDPAEVDARVAGHERFTQWRMRARDVRLRQFIGFDWLVSDMNIDPRSTMAAIERVVTAPGVRLRGVIATLKLPEWSRAGELGAWLGQFRAGGYEPAARQLSTGGREVCVVAVAAGGAGRPLGHVSPARRPARRRPGR